MRLASYVPEELAFPVPLSGSIPELPHVEKANHPLRLLERLNQTVQQDAIKATVSPSNAIPEVFVEGVHERPG